MFGLLAAGCYDSSMLGRDVGTPDAGPCAPVAGYTLCTPECGGLAACPRPGHDCTGVICVPYFTECEAWSAPARHESGGFCTTGDTACVQDPRFGRGVGNCVPEAACDRLSSIGLSCYWSDLSEWDGSPPPVSTCPTPDGSSPLCGGACGDCPVGDAPIGLVHCMARNGERDVGICTGLGGTCSATEPGALRSPPDVYVDAGWGLQDTVCLVYREPDGSLEETGYPAPDSGCRAYRALFPEEVECLDETWTSIP